MYSNDYLLKNGITDIEELVGKSVYFIFPVQGIVKHNIRRVQYGKQQEWFLCVPETYKVSELGESIFFTKEEALGKFVKFSDLSGGEDIGEDDFIFVTASKYQADQKALEQYKQGIADELANCLKVGDAGELDSITIGQIKSKKINDK